MPRPSAFLHRCLPPLLLAAAAATAGENPYHEAMRAIAEGRFEDARQSLNALAAQEPEHAGAWLDLAILQCGLGHREEAEALFSAIELRFSPPTAIREMINEQRRSGCRRQPPRQQLRLLAGRGHDSNANQGARNPHLTIGSGVSQYTLALAPEYTPRGDGFSSLQAEITLPAGNNGATVFSHLLHRRYDTLSRYDLSTAAVGIEHPWSIGPWRLRTLASASLLGLGGRLHQSHLLAQGQVIPPLPLPPAWQLSLIGALSLQTYPAQPEFNAQQHEWRMQALYQRTDQWLQASIGLLHDIGSPARPGGDRQGWTSTLSGRIPLGEKLSGEGTWSAIRWRGREDYAPGLIDHRREQTIQQLRFSLRYALDRHHALVGEYRLVDNHENIGIFSYRSRQFSLNWQWQP